MGLDLGLCKLCDHITVGHTFLSPQGGDFVLIVEEREFFFNIAGEIICFPK